MKILNKHIFIYLFTWVFLVCLISPISISLQYGDNSSYNEIEHSDTVPFTELNEEVKHKVKLFQDLFVFQILSAQIETASNWFDFEQLKDQINPSVTTPPPEIVG